MTDGITRRTTVAAASGLLLPSRATAAAPPADLLDDASGLNATRVARSVAVKGEVVQTLRREIGLARMEGRAVALGGARHSMGGQSLPRMGVALSLDRSRPDVDTRSLTYRVGGGARWRDVIDVLRPLGFSPKVMQSNNDFSVGGTFCVNAHGWPAPLPPMGSTVRSIRIMLADGTVVEASPSREPELFALAMGGYGLFGVILDLDLEMTADRAMTPTFARMPAADLAHRFRQSLAGPEAAELAYGRLSVAQHDFLSEALLVTYGPAAGKPPAGAGRPGLLDGLTRSIYRGQVGSEAMKRSRWYAETVLAPALHPRVVARNTLLDTSASVLASRDRSRIDILHEYFLPPDRLEAFLAVCRTAIPRSGMELLNVTLRYVAEDQISVMRFASTERIAAVMSFSQLKTPQADRSMKGLTEALIDAALAESGSYYLPYRLHARADQLERAYPRVGAFAAAKRRFDPELLFRNALWDQYFARP